MTLALPPLREPRRQGTDAHRLVNRGRRRYKRTGGGPQAQGLSRGPHQRGDRGLERAVKEQPERWRATGKTVGALIQKATRGQSTTRSRSLSPAARRWTTAAITVAWRKKAAGRRDSRCHDAGPRQRTRSRPPRGAALFLWAAARLGIWGDAFERLAAARQGVGDKVRNYSESLNALDERYEDAAGHRVLGRLHTLAPLVLFSRLGGSPKASPSPQGRLSA